MAVDDPFPEAHEDTQEQLVSARGLYSSYQRIKAHHQKSTTSASGGVATWTTSPELQSARADLEAALSDLHDDIRDLSDAVAAAERDPGAFGLDGLEVSRRRRLVSDAAAEVDDMLDDLMRDGIPGVGGGGAQPLLRNPFGTGATLSQARSLDAKSPSPRRSTTTTTDRGVSGYRDSGGNRNYSDNNNNDYAVEFEQQTQEQILREQDEQLDHVFTAVGNLRNMADTMSRELIHQVELLSETDRMTERVGDRLATGMDRMKHVMRRNEDGMSSCCIGLLILVLCILVVLLLVL